MRIMTITAALAAASAAAACASGPPGPNSYRADFQRLEQGCAQQGGILVPTGAATGRPSSEYACEIRNPSRLNDRDD